MKVSTEYEFIIVAGRGESSVVNLAREAKGIAVEYFGREDGLQIEMTVKGKQAQQGKTQDSDNLHVSCVARMEVEV